MVGDAHPTRDNHLMSEYRRARVPGGTYFFTVVTYRRQGFLTAPESREALRDAIADVRKVLPFSVDAWVLLPDHLHCIWTLPEGDQDFSKRWGMIKAGFSKRVKNHLHHESWMTASKRKHRESTLWQRRFWEHVIRDETDYRAHVDYVHFNPVKHGLTKRVCDWPFSTFHRYLERGVYTADWGGGEIAGLDGEVGE